MSPETAGQASALRAAAAFLEQHGLAGLRVTAAGAAVLIEVPQAAGSPAARTGLVARLAAEAGAAGLARHPGAWQETVTAAGRIGGHRAVITTVIYDDDQEETTA